MKLAALLAASAACITASQAGAAVITQSFTVTATGFGANAPIQTVSGRFTFTYDNAAFITPPSPAGLAISGFNAPFNGPALFTFNKGNNFLLVGNNIGLVSYTVSPNTPGFGFFIQNPGGAPIINSLVYSTGGGQVWTSSRVTVAAVPEPAAWAMMIAGFGLAGAALRTARRRAAFA